MGEDSNGNMQYKEETVCGDEDNYLYNVYNRWGTSNSMGNSSTYVRCLTRDASIQTPMDCPEWSIDSVSVTSGDCRGMLIHFHISDLRINN